jgi:uncharacterized membrane protein YeaQ/YmgE (transglycosylase-associated protein family)
MPPILMILIIGTAAGFLATRAMKVNTDVPTTIAIGIGGAFVGWLILRILLAIAGWTAGFIGSVLGAVVLIWLWQRWSSR